MTKVHKNKVARNAISSIKQVSALASLAKVQTSDLRDVLKEVNNLDIAASRPFFEALDKLATENQRTFDARDKDVIAQENESKNGRRVLARTPEELSESSRNRFGFLFNRTIGEVIELMADDHPKDIAVVLAQLPDHSVAEILRGLEPVQRLSVVKRLCTDQDANAVEELDIANSLRRRLESRDKSGEISTTRQNKIANVLQLMGTELNEEIRSQLGSQVSYL